MCNLYFICAIYLTFQVMHMHTFCVQCNNMGRNQINWPRARYIMHWRVKIEATQISHMFDTSVVLDNIWHSAKLPMNVAYPHHSLNPTIYFWLKPKSRISVNTVPYLIHNLDVVCLHKRCKDPISELDRVATTLYARLFILKCW